MGNFLYRMSKTGKAFHSVDSKVKGVRGPYGSGKTVMLLEDSKYYCMTQRPNKNGVRHSRVGVFRNTYPKLTSTIRNTILHVYPSEYGTVREGGAPIKGLYEWPQNDGTLVRVEFVLMALQTVEEAEENLKSMDLSFAIMNEATDMAYGVFAAVLGRVGRFPSEDEGGCSWAGVLMDTNQPPQGHWYLNLEAHPEHNYSFFVQPAAAFKKENESGPPTYTVNDEAENLRNLGGKSKPDDFDEWELIQQEAYLIEKGKEYYADQITAWMKDGRTDKIDSLFCMLDVPMKDGKPVFPEFKYELHVAHANIEPLPYTTVVIGYDTSGVHPAAVFYQENGGKWAQVDELYGEGMGLEAFLDQLIIPLLRNRYTTCPVVVSCDPANARDSYTGLAPSTHLKNAGLEVFMPKTNDPKTRQRAVSSMLNKNIGGIIISPHCTFTIQAMQGGYRFKKTKVLGAITAAYSPTPDKNEFSHIADAVQYMAMFVNQGELTNSQETDMTVRRLSQRRRTLGRIV